MSLPNYPGDGALIAANNRIATTVEQQSLVVAGQNNPLRIIYGRQIVGGDIIAIGGHDGNLVLACVWGEGEIDAVERYWINGLDPHPNIVATHYTGTSTQNPDPTLAEAFSKGLFVYQDSLPNVAYSVFEIQPNVCSGFPEITALIRGLKVASTFGGTKAYSTNPAYCIADFIENTRYGMGRTVDWTSVATVAEHADAMIGSPAETRHIFSLVLDSPEPVENWLDIMRDSADCWIVPEGSGYRLVLDSTGSVGAARSISGIAKTNPMRITASGHGFASGAIVKVTGITAGVLEANGRFGVVRYVSSSQFDLDGIDATGFSTWTAGGTATQIGASAYSFTASTILEGSLRLAKRGIMASPTVVEVEYTETGSYPWRTESTQPAAFIPGVYDNPPTVPFRRTRVTKPGITRHSEAYRYAVELLNSAQLDDLSASFVAVDAALAVQAGDLIDITHPAGLDAKIMRVTSIDPSSPGRWSISATEHDDAKYSDAVVTAPSTTDTTLASPLDPPKPTGLTLTEIITRVASGDFVSRVAATWNEMSAPVGTYPFVGQYRIEVWDGANLVETGTAERSLVAASPPSYTTAALPENRLYTFHVFVISTIGAVSAPAEASYTNSGKQAVPSDVPSITGYEVGGLVFLDWEPATDLDLTGYEIRWGATTDSWESAPNLLDRLQAIHYETRAIPAGTWRVFIKALDSIRSPAHPWGQESANAATCDVTVTSDAAAFVAVDFDYTAATLAKFAEGMAGSAKFWITDSGVAWNTALSFVVSSYPIIGSALLDEFLPTRSALVTDVKDHGASISANWTGTLDYTADMPIVDTYLDLNAAGGDSPYSVTGVPQLSPLRLTVSSHPYSTGDELQVESVGGISVGGTAIGTPGIRAIATKIDTNTVELYDFAGTGIVGTGSYTSGGTTKRWTWFGYPGMVANATARYSRMRVTTSSGIARLGNLGHVRANVVARHEGGIVTTASSGPTVVTFANTYNKAVSASAVPIFEGATAPDGSRCVVDMIEVSGGRGINALYLLRFNGSNDYVSVGDHASYEFGGGSDSAFSIEFWLKLTSLVAGGQAVISKGNADGSGSYYVRVGAAGKVQFVLCDSTNAATVNCATSTLLTLGTWYHVACTYSGSSPTTPGNMKVYLNGAAEVTTIITTNSYTRMRDTAVALEFGRHADASHYLDGRLDEVRIWGKALSAAEVADGMFKTSGFSAGTPVSRWGFDEGSGTSATDSGSAAHNGTLSGGPPAYRPYNGLDLYLFNTSGTQVAGKAAWSFDGV